MMNANTMQTVDTEKEHEHSLMVSRISAKLAAKAGLSDSDVEITREAARLHDIGKNFVPGDILKKPGRLTDHEYAVVKTHAQSGFVYLANQVKIFLAAAIIALQHHEKPSGNGYAGVTHIHTLARLVAVADVFDALISARPYKVGWPPDEVIGYMKANANKEFDADYVDVLLNSMDEILAMYEIENNGMGLREKAHSGTKM